MFGVLLIVLGVVGLVADGRGYLPEQGYDWVPGAATASLVIGILLLVARLGRDGSRGVGVALACGGAGALLTDRWFGWIPDNLDTGLTIGCWVAIVLGAIVWLAGMTAEHGAGGLGIGLGVVAVASLVADSAFDLPAPWDATLNVVSAACICGALCAGLAGFGSAIEERDLLGTAYTWLTSAVVGPLGVSVTAIVAASAFDEPAWVFTLLVILVVLGALGAAAAVFLGARELSRSRQTFVEYEKLVAVERAQRRLADDDVEFDEDELAGLWADAEWPGPAESPEDRAGSATATRAPAEGRASAPEVARSRAEAPGVARSRVEASGVARSRVEASGVARSRADAPAADPVPTSTAARPRGRRVVPAVLSIVADTIAIVTVLVAAANFLLR